MNWILMLVGLVGIYFQYRMSKYNGHDQPPIGIWIGQYTVMVAVVVLGAFSQYSAEQSEKSYKVAQFKSEVFSLVSREYPLVMKNYFIILKNDVLVSNYLSFEKSQSQSDVVFDWKKYATEGDVKRLEQVQMAFEDLQNIATKIIQLQMETNGVIPIETYKWAQQTLELQFEDLDMYFSTYKNVELSKKYASDLGKAFGAVIGNRALTSNILTFQS